MIATYRARLKTGDHLDWLDDHPDAMMDDVPVLITLLADPAESWGADYARRCVALLAQIADSCGGCSSISDPVVWQKEQRMETCLPGRE